MRLMISVRDGPTRVIDVFKFSANNYCDGIPTLIPVW